MKSKHCASSLALLAALTVTAIAHAQTEKKYKMTTEIPAEITTPNIVKSRIGTLEFNDGFPTDGTMQKVYDNQSRSMLQTDQPFPSIGNDKKGVTVNSGGSVDVWFGPTAPQGHESNWVQTVPGKGWNVVMRLYGPEEAWFDKTWRPGEIELVK